jgi:hypothetical protein
LPDTPDVGEVRNQARPRLIYLPPATNMSKPIRTMKSNAGNTMNIQKMVVHFVIV